MMRAANLKEIKTVYVGAIGKTAASAQFQASLRSEVTKSHKLRLAADAASADAVITGNGEIFVKGHYSLNPRQREIGADSRALYSGYLSVELIGDKGETLWSYLAAPAAPTDGDVAKSMARKVITKLLEAIAGDHK